MPYLASLQSTLHYTSVTRAAISHSPQLRTAVQAISKRDSECADRVRKDDEVWARAREVGLDEDGMRRQLRVMLKRATEMADIRPRKASMDTRPDLCGVR